MKLGADQMLYGIDRMEKDLQRTLSSSNTDSELQSLGEKEFLLFLKRNLQSEAFLSL